MTVGAGGAPAAALDGAIDRLRAYLDEVRFVALHKFLTSAGVYAVSAPNVIRLRHREMLMATGSYLDGDSADLGLALALLADVPCAEAALQPRHRELAAELCGVGLLQRQAEGQLRMAGLQLVSVQDMPLLVDRRLNFGGGLHEVYCGPDSVLLTYYVDHQALRPGARGLDLGTGTGVLALYLARFCARVTATDIMPAPLALATLNRRLNRAQERLEVRREPFIETLSRGERYDIVSFNPPFIALPDDVPGPVFAKGIGADGLDYCRMLIELFDEVVAPGGVVYMVADLLGDQQRPHFAAELEGYARALDLAIDVYIDDRVDLRTQRQHEVLASGVSSHNPGVQHGELVSRIQQHQLEHLGADCTYCSVMVLRRAPAVGRYLNLWNRFAC